MSTRKRIMTTTALGLLIAATPLAMQRSLAAERSAGMVLAQAEKPEGMTEEAWRALLKKRGGEAQEEEAPAEEEAAPAAEPEEAPEAEAAPPAPEPEPGQPAAGEEAPAEPPVETPEDTESAPAMEEPTEPESEAAPEEVPAEAEAPEEQAPTPVKPEAEEEAPPAKDAPAEDERVESEPEAAPKEAPAETEASEEPAPSPPEDEAAEEPAPTAEPPVTETEKAAPTAGEQPEAEGEAVPQAPETTEPVDEERPATDTEEPQDAREEPEAGARPEQQGSEPLPENAAPVLDSAKEPEAGGEAQPRSETEAPEADGAEASAEARRAPPPESDAEAQADAVDPETLRTEIRNILEEQGQRIEMGATREERSERQRELRQRREDAEVVREFNDNRTIIQINNQVFVESQDSDRLIRDDDEVFYEELPRGRVREVVTRPNGVRLITVRNRYGDVIRRVRIAPDGREQVLVFVPDERLDTVDRWRDPARDLPPLRLTIPVSDYILEAEQVEDPDRYYTFLEKPPVERVRRMYSLEEVKRSARVRDMVRRVDLDTIEFAFGSADIEESEIDELEAIATAIERMLDENPAETFLIEGHTDAVGSDLANLALSDRRAESVARALTDVFGIPPENLVTQGYGERYLKIDTQERERENRRVALRRITPLVAPVASAN
ncbi:OmpA family protein [Nitratireductor sp. L1-7-SE]|uniref:OmpA family protein n=1 Tax=Nitratireductor rhodophyticola TaxID=2854036 RepID=A0ABS7R8W3_9HYPH|nr:OmpA family protein [Nitratireductor rhodophyticola]MBY8917374.1 OmpA family protein [Nitratireductor rhodophyticola]MBY8922085.1 OmpA family protein [Nitratireductor rhodophyticola]